MNAYALTSLSHLPTLPQVLAAAYVYFAGGGGAASTMAMDEEAFTEFVTACGLEDGAASVYAAACNNDDAADCSFTFPPRRKVRVSAVCG
jgi:hypothetical protein